MNEVRILFTGIGRRVELLQAFQQAAFCLGVDLKIFGTDIAPTAPAISYCNYFRKVCGMRDKEYIPQLIELCENDKIDMIIPTIDTDLQVLSENVGAFKNTKVLISKPDKIAICRDKNNTADFFEQCGCKAPKTVNDWEVYEHTYSYPCFIKPKDGSSSINAFKVESREELHALADKLSDYVIQPYIEGTEYTVDAFCDCDGSPIYIIPRIRLKVRAGEVLQTKIDLDERIIEECKRIIARFKPVGPITIQLIRQKETGEDYYIEINPRFGGGAPLSMKAGARSAEDILYYLTGKSKPTDKTVIADRAIFSRFDQSVCIIEGQKTQPIRGVVFDLDDTLYNEKQYVKSGFKAVADHLGDAQAENKLWEYFNQGKPAIDFLLEDLGCLDKKSECLEIYRYHKPDLTLNDGVEDLLIRLRAEGIKIGIITDGRPEGQRRKIASLGLESMVDDIIVTDELGGTQFRKPCDISFRIMQRKWAIPFEQLIYIGDNMNKDFRAPRQLGMHWILMKNPDGLYRCCDAVVERSASDFDDVYKIIKGFNDDEEA